MTSKTMTRPTQTTDREDITTVGNIFLEAREKRALALEEASTKTKIPLWFITALEKNAHDKLGDDIYSRIWIKSYASFLGLDAKQAYEAHLYERQKHRSAIDSASERIHPKKSVPTSHTLDTPKLIRHGLLGIALFAIGLYFAAAVTNTITPPEINLTSPTDGFTTSQRTITVEGQTEKEVSLLINGKSISTDSSGNFIDTLDLHEGLNIITITGSKKHSKEMTITRRVIVEPREKATSFFGPIE